MKNYINCIAHNSSEGNLLIGEKFTALFDCGMAFCADETIANVRDALGKRKLDYIFLTHTHYDHLGALPFFRKEWPELQAVTSAIGAEVLLRETPRRVIREMSETAAKMYGRDIDLDYDDDVFHADLIVKEGDEIDLGGLTLRIIETPGHTRDSLSFLVLETGLFILSETSGVLLPELGMHPCFLSSYKDCLLSIEKCSKIDHKMLSLPHRGAAPNEETAGFFDRAMEAAKSYCDFIIGMREKEFTEEEMLDSFTRHYFNPALEKYQPKAAFMLNARAMINCVLKKS